MSNNDDGEQVPYPSILPPMPSQEESVSSGRPAPQAGSPMHAQSTQGPEQRPGPERILPQDIPARNQGWGQRLDGIPTSSGSLETYLMLGYHSQHIMYPPPTFHAVHPAYSQAAARESGRHFHLTFGYYDQSPYHGACLPPTQNYISVTQVPHHPYGVAGTHRIGQAMNVSMPQPPAANGTETGSAHMHQEQEVSYGGYYPDQNHAREEQCESQEGRAVSPGPPIQKGDRRGPTGANLYIFHIPNEWTNMDLYELFNKVGPVLSARIGVDSRTGRGKGYGFVSYNSAETAKVAIRRLNGHRIGKKRLKVEHKKPSNFHDQSSFQDGYEYPLSMGKQSHFSDRPSKPPPTHRARTPHGRYRSLGAGRGIPATDFEDVSYRTKKGSPSDQLLRVDRSSGADSLEGGKSPVTQEAAGGAHGNPASAVENITSKNDCIIYEREFLDSLDIAAEEMASLNLHEETAVDGPKQKAFRVEKNTTGGPEARNATRFATK